MARSGDQLPQMQPGSEPATAKPAYRLRILFAVLGVVLGAVAAVWAAMTANGDRGIQVAGVVAALVAVAGLVDVVYILRIRSSHGQRPPK